MNRNERVDLHGRANDALAARAFELCRALIGPVAASGSKEIFVGDFTITVRGHRAGSWTAQWPSGSPRDAGNDWISLIAHVNGTSFGRAASYAQAFLAKPPAAADGGDQ